MFRYLSFLFYWKFTLLLLLYFRIRKQMYDGAFIFAISAHIYVVSDMLYTPYIQNCIIYARSRSDIKLFGGRTKKKYSIDTWVCVCVRAMIETV